MKHLIIGAGEIGRALQEILDCEIRDIDTAVTDIKKFDVIHICFPNSQQFGKFVNAYKKMYKAKYVVVHSTVPVGMCKMLKVMHSPVTGVHPHLKESILTFTKFVSGAGAIEMCNELMNYGIPARPVRNSSNTEAGKLFSLLIYGINVLLEKEIHAYCKENKLDYDVVYGSFVDMYNRGYEAMGQGHFKMYDLVHKKGKIGGHCVIQNAPLLKTEFSKILSTLNDKIVV